MPDPIRYVVKMLGFVREYAIDLWLFMRHNNHSPLEDRNRRRYFRTIILSHAIEKGLSLSRPRPLFGRDKVKDVIAQLRLYNKAFSEFPVGMASGALADYYDHNVGYAVEDDVTLREIKKYLEREGINEIQRTGGVRKIVVSMPANVGEIIYFLRSRTSCRMFAKDALGRRLIEEVLSVAQSAPSQCNRQSVRVHFYQSSGVISDLLRFQGGSSGFGENIGNLFVVTSEITAWGGPQQRNQLYVDGGLYSMMLMLACQSKGIATCPLNLAVTNSVEREIKRIGRIPASQRLIMMIAAGYTSEDMINAARSPRCSVNEILQFH